MLKKIHSFVLNVFAAFVIRKLLLLFIKFIFEKTLQNAIGKFENSR